MGSTSQSCSNSKPKGFPVEQRNEIVLSMMGRAYSYGQGLERRHGIDHRDVAHECAVKMIERLDRSDPEDVDDPQAYVMFCIKEGFRSALQKHYSNKRTNEREAVPIGDEDEGSYDPSSGDAVDMLMRAKMMQLREKLDTRERQVMDALYYGGAHGTTDAADVLGLSPRRVSDANSSLLDKVRHAFDGGTVKRIERPRKSDVTVYLFKHENGEEARMTRADFMEHSGLNKSRLSQIMNGHKPSANGWRFCG